MESNAFPEREHQEFFANVTEEETTSLWHSIKGLSETDAWSAIVTGLTLHAAFAKTKAGMQIEH